ncbi:hypothetical protein FJU31_13640 [Stenotrophomonas cyclobalanopsidis]|uniref:HNH nuclease domain-containing protein n=1 Tax=Stenotrophomonas cyclobalanopsidis TaxID=2771362 RepID=A0ABQ6SZ68_9GAMM|nr:RHS repeat-associated core domain-containing protein [Stenotrophomonas cyclobalanopsidis]KAA8996316.1 hypothetical protein FJU31_13640 [Stenotrophomonas cyclobalanopsidis]
MSNLISRFTFCWLSLLCMVASASAQTVTYIHTDALGSVVAESDANGNVIKRYDYEPYGAVVGGEVTDGPGYTGHVSDASTGLSYMQQRYMDPQLGVFLSVDPVTAYEQPVGQFNRYRYANGNPYKFTDPDGRYAIVAEVILIPLAAGAIYYFSTTPEQRQELGRDISRALKGALQKSEAPKNEPALVSDGSIVSDREPGSDGKWGSTGGPGAGKRFPKESPEVRAEKEGIPCAYCGTSTTNTYGLPNSRERDHIDPASKGGNNSPENERDACRTCNREKGANNPDEWEKR